MLASEFLTNGAIRLQRPAARKKLPRRRGSEYGGKQHSTNRDKRLACRQHLYVYVNFPYAATMTTQKTYSIGELAREFQITTRTIRFYEDQGLLHPQRRGQTRIYLPSDRVALKLILRGKRLGLSLAESRELIQLYIPTGDNRHQLQALLDKIAEKRAMLAQQLKDIQAMQQEMDEAEQRAREAMMQLENNNV